MATPPPGGDHASPSPVQLSPGLPGALYLHANRTLADILQLLAEDLQADTAQLGIDLGHGYRSISFESQAGVAVMPDAHRIETCPLSIGIALRRDKPRSLISLARHPERSAFSTSDRRRLAQLLPHLNQAFTLAYEMEHLRQRNAYLQNALDRADSGLLLISHQAKILVANTTARQRLAAIGATLDTYLHWSQPVLERRFTAALETTHLHGEATFTARTDAGALVVLYMRQHPDDATLYSITVRSSHISAARLSKQVAGHFSLTPAELKLCQLLTDGLTLKECACTLDCSYETLRTRMKVLFQKTGTHRQSQLLALLDAFRSA